MDAQETILLALERLEELTQIKTEYKPSNLESDGMLQLLANNEKHLFSIAVKHHLRESNLPFLRGLTHQTHPILIITNYVSDTVKKGLQKEGLLYLDTSGNAHIRAGRLFIHIQGQKEKQVQKAKTAKAFNATGLRILFALLNDPELVNSSYRYLAQFTGVALGSVATVMQELKDQELVVELDEHIRKLSNLRSLLNRWVMEYGENLRPKLFAGKYRFLKEDSHWKTLKLNTQNTNWGGEPAADLITHYLKPEKLILYSSESRSELMKNYRLVPDSAGNIIVYKPFWKLSNYPKWQIEKIVPPALIYTDLMLTNDDRTTDTAQRVYEKFLSHFN
jgi:hypothetical protein